MVKKLWLIQPHDPPGMVLPIDAAGGGTIHFSPAWDLLCLHAFILERTGHRAEIIDLRLFDALPDAFSEKVSGNSGQIIALIYATSHTLGSVGELIRFLKNEFPQSRIILFGPYPSAYPETLHLMPGIDFALSGDPEIKLRHLLDALDVHNRIRSISGVYSPGTEMRSAHWLPDLKNLSLPDFQQHDWRPYRVSKAQRGARIEARISRGNPGLPVDAAWPGAREPLRKWPILQMAQWVKRCPGNGIEEIFFSDPPGVWQDEVIAAWCSSLRSVRNNQEWSFQLMARDLPDAILNELPVNGCHRIQLIIPSVNPERQKEFGMDIPAKELKKLISRMRQRSIDAQLVYWTVGPFEESGEADMIFQHLRSLGRPPFAVHAFPCLDDSPLALNPRTGARKPPNVFDWISASTDAAGHFSPDPLWGGTATRKEADTSFRRIHRKIVSSPLRLIRRLVPASGVDWGTFFQKHASEAWKKVARPAAGAK